MDFEREKGKSQQIAERVEAEIISGKLQPGSRMKSVRELAGNFSVSLRSVQIALDLMEEKGFIERRRGSGTFIKKNNLKKDNTVYFLVPHPSHITLKYESNVFLRRLIYGAVSAAIPGQLIQSIPVSKTNVPVLGDNPGAIDWETLKRIPPGANVFISSTWYRDIIPFLAERSVRGVFLSIQYDQEYPEMCKIIQNAEWDIITLDRLTAMQRVVEYLHSLGRRKIVALKYYGNQPEHPLKKGFISGYKNCGMDFREDFFQEIALHEKDSLENIITKLWEKTKFDALVSCVPDTINPVFGTITKKIGLKIPDDAALIAFRDMPEYLELGPRISAFEFPLADVGAELINIFSSKNHNTKDTRFQASIIERGSTVKGLAGSLNQAFMPELLSANRKIMEVA